MENLDEAERLEAAGMTQSGRAAFDVARAVLSLGAEYNVVSNRSIPLQAERWRINIGRVRARANYTGRTIWCILCACIKTSHHTP